jgi:hypothetical protein
VIGIELGQYAALRRIAREGEISVYHSPTVASLIDTLHRLYGYCESLENTIDSVKDVLEGDPQ